MKQTKVGKGTRSNKLPLLAYFFGILRMEFLWLDDELLVGWRVCGAGTGVWALQWEPTGCMFTVFPGLDTLVWPVERRSPAAVHTIWLLQLSCPLPAGLETGRTDLDPHVAVLGAAAHHLMIYGLILVFLPKEQMRTLCFYSEFLFTQLRGFCLINMLSDLFLDHLAVLFIMAQFTAYKTYCFTTQTHARTHTDTQANMLTCSSVTRKTATGCGLGTKTFSELSEDAWSREAPSQNVKHFWCQNRQAQALIWGEMMLKQEQHWRCIRPWRFACF